MEPLKNSLKGIVQVLYFHENNFCQIFPSPIQLYVTFEQRICIFFPLRKGTFYFIMCGFTHAYEYERLTKYSNTFFFKYFFFFNYYLKALKGVQGTFKIIVVIELEFRIFLG